MMLTGTVFLLLRTSESTAGGAYIAGLVLVKNPPATVAIGNLNTSTGVCGENIKLVGRTCVLSVEIAFLKSVRINSCWKSGEIRRP